MLRLVVAGLLIGLGFELGRHGLRASVSFVAAAFKKIFKKS